jgi:citrate lyase subunit beta/citryl-CoA lyase
VIVPKVESVDELAAVDRLLTDLEEEADAGRPIGIEVQIESARGLVEVERIAGSSQPRLETLVFGPGDYAATLGVPQRSVGETDPDYPGDQWHYARSRIATAAHAFGLAPIDGPYAAIRDLDGLRESARQARLVGFEGKWVVHPDQIPVCDEVFSPTPEELADALSVLEGLEGAAAEGRGASLHDGRMVDEASRRIAEAVVRRAEAAGVGAS